MRKDTLERAREPTFDLKAYLANAYLHPVFKGREEEDNMSISEDVGMEEVIVPTKRQSRRNTPAQSKYEGSDTLSLPATVHER